MADHPLFRDLTLGLDLRPFQEQALAALRRELDGGGRRLHVVAPPGAGKTVLGLAWVLERATPAVILSPTSTIAAQWVSRFRDAVVSLDELYEADELIGSDGWADPLPPVVSITYQAVSVKDADTSALHANAAALLARLEAAGVRSVVLDECHHLLSHWADVLSDWLARVPDACVLGLTATPPIDADREQRARHHSLLGAVTYEIPLPALVRTGHLAPYQDLALVVSPTERELAYIKAAHADFATLVETLDVPPEPLLSWRLWLAERLERVAAGEGEHESWQHALSTEPDWLISLARVGLQLGVALPAEAWAVDEMEEEPTLDDQVAAIEDYSNGYLLPLASGGALPDGLKAESDAERAAAESLRDAARRALRSVGYTLTTNGTQRRSAAMDRLLGLSSAKFGALETILVAELATLQEDLRAVVVVDFETATAGRLVRELDGVLDPEAGGAISVLRFIASHADLDELDAVMVTGQNLVCDRDVAPIVVEALQVASGAHGWRIQTQTETSGGLVRVVGSGPDWSASRYALLVTELFERGTIRCIVGTRGLLGEGWDSHSANVLVDLTSAAAFVSANQLRGRCLRTDPERPEKVANLWDVVAVAPQLERGFADWDRFVRKHGHVYGVADDGAIEEGVGHVHPVFSNAAPSTLAGYFDIVNADMLRRAGERRVTREAWRVGETFANETVASVEVRGVAPLDPCAPDTSPPPGVVEARAAELAARIVAHDAAVAAAQAGEARAAESAKALREEARAVRETVTRENQTALVPLTTRVARAERAVRASRRVRAPLLGLLGAIGALGALAAPPVALAFLAAAAATVGADVAVASALRRRAVDALAASRAEASARAGTAERAAQGLEARAALLELAAAHERERAIAAAEDALAAHRRRAVAVIDAEEQGRLYAMVLLDAFRRWESTASQAGKANVVTSKRSDGALHVELHGADTEFTGLFAAAFRSLTGPLADHRYLLRVPCRDLDSALDRALRGRDQTLRELDKAADGAVAFVPVPDPLSTHRSGADAFATAWRAAAGDCDVLYTRRGEGAELRARSFGDRWWSGRARGRRVWR
ncbi:MAG: DEAD/DEAH box helicase family protein [Myxococcales bacterium]|nr:DEAD/DEAH box helicase family protein [Myxococcales bacterium]MCB9534242.1 DEAD/DEAH box helicase family protein [Myxococcales bacterium]